MKTQAQTMKRMGRIFSLLCVAALMLTTTSCGNSGGGKQSDKNYAIGSDVEIGHFSYNVEAFGFAETVGESYFSQEADGIFLLVGLTLKNISKEDRTMNGSSFYVTDENGVKYEYSISGSTALEMSGSDVPTLFMKDCKPNIPIEAILIFEVPKEAVYYLHVPGDIFGKKYAKVTLQETE